MLISVIIPTYNRGRLLARSVQSVLDQSGAEMEVIIVDDASTDNTRQVVEAMTDSRVRYIRLEQNSGACTARNTGIAAARGEMIAFQDSDDIWLPGKLEKQLAAMEETGADIVFCAFERFSPEGVSLGVFPRESVERGRIAYEQLLEENLISTQTMLGKRTCFEQVQFRPDFPRLQDWEVVLRLAQRYHIHYMKETLVHLCEQNDSISRYPERAVTALHMLCEIHRETLENNERLLTRMLFTLEMAYRACGRPAWPLYVKALSFRRKIRTNLFCACRVAICMVKGWRKR